MQTTQLNREDSLKMLAALKADPQFAAAVEWRNRWLRMARRNQITPQGDWRVWFCKAGRGWGKTRVGAEDTGWYAASYPGVRVGIIAPTASDIRDTCFEGESGLLSVIPTALLRGGSRDKAYNRSLGELYLANGSMFKGYSSEEPDRLRGPQHHRLWCLAGDTPVLMGDGTEKPIAAIREGDMVRTRNGVRRVLCSSLTKRQATVSRLRLVDGRDIVATNDHRVFIEGHGFIPISSISAGMRVCAADASSGVARSGIATATPTTVPSSGCTAKSGWLRTALSRRGITSTTSTATKVTIAWKTSSCLRLASTALGISRKRLGPIGLWPSQILAPLANAMRLSALNGFSTAPAAGANIGHHPRSPENTARTRAWKPCDLGSSPPKTDSARAAEIHFWLRVARSFIALNGAILAQPRIERTVWSCGTSSAPSVVRPSVANAPTPGSAPRHMPPNFTRVAIATVEGLPQRVDVYDITVEHDAEFFANGILVHNCEELPSWKNQGMCWDMAMFGLRLVHADDTPETETKTIVTATPKPTPLVRHLVALESTIMSVGSTYENKSNLSQKFFETITAYEGTKLGRQEIHAEILDPEEEGIYQRSWFRLWPAAIPLPAFDLVIQSYDTALKEQNWNDPTACTVWGVFNARTVFRPEHILRMGIRLPWIALLLDAWCDRLGYPALRSRVIADFKMTYGAGVATSGKPLLGRAGNAYPGRKVDLVLVEDKGSGISLLQDLAAAGIPAQAYNPGGDGKVTRAHVTSHFVKNGSVWLPESSAEERVGQPRDWAEPFLSQVCAFNGDPLLLRDARKARARGIHDDQHDDYVDTMTQVLSYLGDSGWIKADLPPPETLPTRDPVPKGNPYAA